MVILKLGEVYKMSNWKPCFAVVLAIVLLLCVNNQVWATNYIAIDLNIKGFWYSNVLGTSGGQQVGYGRGPGTGGYTDALLWTGSAASAVDLNPSGFTSSEAHGTNGGQQVGYGQLSVMGEHHALLWNGSAASAVDLNPSGFTSSEALGISGGQQVGYGRGSSTLGANHALLWSGSAESAVDLNPNGFDNSSAYGISGGQQVGSGKGSATGGNIHALLWSGSSASAVDLNPSGFNVSFATGTNGVQQVGYVSEIVNGITLYHAFVWNNSATSAVDLGQFLPNGWKDSEAEAIDDQGNIVGYGVDRASNTHPILWQPVPVPEPATFVMLGMAALSFGLFWRWKQGG
jgi:hypothetical protein